MTSPILGTLCFASGGLCGALFAVPLRRIRGWGYESYWFVYAIVGMVVLPLALSFAFVPDLLGVYSSVSPKVVVRCALFGMMWGVGGLTWGLMKFCRVWPQSDSNLRQFTSLKLIKIIFEDRYPLSG